MKQPTLSKFVSLLEAMVQEDSTSIDTLRGVPGAVPLLQQLHQARKIPADLQYQKIDSIPWSEIKQRRYSQPRSIVLVAGKHGAGVLMTVKHHGYALITLNSDGKLDSQIEDSGGRSMQYFKQRLGPITGLWLGQDTDSIQRKQAERQGGIYTQSRGERQPPGSRSLPPFERTEFVKRLMAKFRPLWIKSLDTAIADIAGWHNIMVKNRNYQPAGRKLTLLHDLATAVDQLEHGENGMDIEVLREALTYAIDQTAQHYYPESSGGFAQQYVLGYRRPTLIAQDGVRQVFADIMSGDQTKLSTLLGFFKQNLVRGK